MNNLRKIVCYSLALILLGLATGCGGQKDQIPTSTAPAPKGNKPEIAEDQPPPAPSPPVPRR
jgi:hypothetical protein